MYEIEKLEMANRNAQSLMDLVSMNWESEEKIDAVHEIMMKHIQQNKHKMAVIRQRIYKNNNFHGRYSTDT